MLKSEESRLELEQQREDLKRRLANLQNSPHRHADRWENENNDLEIEKVTALLEEVEEKLAWTDS